MAVKIQFVKNILILLGNPELNHIIYLLPHFT